MSAIVRCWLCSVSFEVPFEQIHADAAGPWVCSTCVSGAAKDELPARAGRSTNPGWPPPPISPGEKRQFEWRGVLRNWDGPYVPRNAGKVRK